MKRWLAIVGFLIFLIVLISGVSFSTAKDFEDPGKPIALIPGEILKIYLAAYEDFSKGLIEDSKNPNETAQIVSKLENYNVEVFDKDKVYVVYFSLNGRKFPFIKGGAKEYKIDKKTYAIIDKIYWR